jgi:ubiquinone/menaquinone biosynthesis C-methylase UbiE
MPDAVSRFSVVASYYDAVRPMPPGELADVIRQWAGVTDPDVVDLGAGTGLSTVIWAGCARQVIAVEPSAQMRALALQRISAAGTTGPARARARTRFDAIDATAEDTGLPGECADVVTASQALHWFDPARALPEIARILRPGGSSPPTTATGRPASTGRPMRPSPPSRIARRRWNGSAVCAPRTLASGATAPGSAGPACSGT